MPISIDSLRKARSSVWKSYTAESSVAASGRSTAFLCHSHKDSDLAEGLQILLANNGWDLYIDWKDHEMPDAPNKETADKIKQKIVQFDWFLFLATPNSSASRWCPWEIGIADTRKTHDRILVIPTTDNSGKWYGNEYLQLYNQIDVAKGGGLARFPAGQMSGGILIKNLR